MGKEKAPTGDHAVTVSMPVAARIGVYCMMVVQERMVDWNELRIFLAVAREGNLTCASRQLGVTQPTVGRRIRNLETRLAARLFERTPHGFELTPAGAAVMRHAIAMEDSVLAVEHAVAGCDAGLSGTVRVTASEWFVPRVLAPMAGALTRHMPGVALELIAGVRCLNLVQREADIAVRPAGFTHHDVFQTRVAELAFGLYASEEYLKQRGEPDFSDRCRGHRRLTMRENGSAIADVAWFDRVAGAAHVSASCNGREAQVSMAEAGAGIACLPRFVGDASRSLRLLRPPQEPPARPLHIGVHRYQRGVPRVAAVVRYIADHLRAMRAAFSPRIGAGTADGCT